MVPEVNRLSFAGTIKSGSCCDSRAALRIAGVLVVTSEQIQREIRVGRNQALNFVENRYGIEGTQLRFQSIALRAIRV
jgi:hypothetical protein